MRFGLIHRVMTDTLAALGIFALVTSGKLDPLVSAVVLLGLLIGLFLPEKFAQHAQVQLVGVVGPLAILAVQVARLSLGGDPIPIVVEFAALLQVVRLATRRGAAHDHQIILLSLLHLIAGTVLGGGLTYAVALMGFLVFTPGALVLSHLRREVEGNYRQGAKDRTGMPVDVPRILRSRRVIGRGFLLFTCGLSIPVFLFSALLFMIFPRVGFAWLNVPPISPSRMVGFSDKVDLGGVGTIRTDSTLVMRVKPGDLKDDSTPAVRRNFYLRGAVFDTYKEGSWSRLGQSSFRPQEDGNQIVIRRVSRPTDRTLDIDLNRIDPPVVFVPGEAIALDVLSGNKKPFELRSMVSTDARGQLQYSSLERQGLVYRAYLPPQGLIFPEREHAVQLARYLEVPPGLTTRIKNLAREMTENQTAPLAIARALEKRLRADYKYDLSSPSGGASDPLDHFLFESKRGHCEYYSTAMAMMLRVRGVPSRNVTGFVGGTFNRFGDFYSVRQGDAHSWVEAYLPKRGWIRFDPTPPSSASPQASTQGSLALLREIFEAASQSWNQNVLGFDVDHQAGILKRLKSFFSVSKISKEWAASAKWNLQRWGAALAGGALLVFGVRTWLVRRRTLTPVGHTSLTRSMNHSIRLYQDLERALMSQGVPRPLSTPPLTHAKALAHARHFVGQEALDLTQIYLQARYGDLILSETQMKKFRDRVSALRRAKSQSEAA